MNKLILASSSPRRSQLLQAAGFLFSSNPVKLSETLDKNLNLDDSMIKLARTKAQACHDTYKFPKGMGNLIIGADTLVVYQGSVLGKPANLDQARNFLHRLSGSTHSVKTALAVYDIDNEIWGTGIDTTQVRFRPLSDLEIEAYIATGEPMDKAGAYAIQGGAARFVVNINGSWSNVVGLPIDLLLRLMNEHNWKPARA